MSTRPRPEFLYRYRSLSTERDAERAMDLIVRSRLYCASLESFDDPFEAGFVSLPDATFATEFRGTFATEYSACCFSEPRDHPLLWSLYADGHRGICLEFSSQHPESPLTHAEPVSYSDVFPVVDFTKGSPEERARAVFLQKSSAWSHQLEWRLIGPNAPGPAPFNPAILTAVILGCRATDVTAQRVGHWLAGRSTSCRLQQARVESGCYRLRIVDVARGAV